MLIPMSVFSAAMPSLPPAKVAIYKPPLETAMTEFEIVAPKRQAAFLAQLGHESNDLKWMFEIWGPTDAQKGYEGRADLGNNQPGDGYRYRGRGPIQLTGKANYRAASLALHVDILNDPDKVSSPEIGFRVAAWFWKTHGLNELADAGAFLDITKRINGGTNGLENRQARFLRIKGAQLAVNP